MRSLAELWNRSAEEQFAKERRSATCQAGLAGWRSSSGSWLAQSSWGTWSQWVGKTIEYKTFWGVLEHQTTWRSWIMNYIWMRTNVASQSSMIRYVIRETINTVGSVQNQWHPPRDMVELQYRKNVVCYSAVSHGITITYYCTVHSELLDSVNHLTTDSFKRTAWTLIILTCFVGLVASLASMLRRLALRSSAPTGRFVLAQCRLKGEEPRVVQRSLGGSLDLLTINVRHLLSSLKLRILEPWVMYVMLINQDGDLEWLGALVKGQPNSLIFLPFFPGFLDQQKHRTEDLVYPNTWNARDFRQGSVDAFASVQRSLDSEDFVELRQVLAEELLEELRKSHPVQTFLGDFYCFCLFFLQTMYNIKYICKIVQ